ncbi:hypothetical protein BsWGS_15538 [Bradybaena similaris]
MTVGR